VERLSRLAALALLALALAPLPARGAPAHVQEPAPREAAPPAIASVELRLPEGEDRAAIEALVTLRPGEPLSRRALRRTVQLLYQLGRFSNVVVRASPGPDGALALVIDCQPRRVVRAVRVRPAPRAIDEDEVVRASGLAEGQELASERLVRAAEAVREAYRRRGWRAAGVEVRAVEERAAGGVREAVAEIAVREGAPTLVAAFQLAGEPGPAAALAGGLVTRAGAVFDERALEADVARLRVLLRERGHLRARVEAPAIAWLGDRVRITLPVHAGPRVRFRFVGQRAFDAAALEARLGLDPDLPLDAAAVQAAAARLRAAYGQRGHADARIAVREAAAGGLVTVLFEIDEGPRYRVGEVRFAGNVHRDDGWLRARLEEALGAGDADGEGADAERAARALGSPRPPRAAPPRRPAESYEPGAWDAAVVRVLDLYRAEGFLDAAHDGTRVALDRARRRADVEIRLLEGPRTVVESVAFEGNAEVPTADLAAAARIAPGDPLSYAALEGARAAILALYARGGRLYARVAAGERISADRARAAVRFQVEEGPLVRVGKVVVSGNRRTRDALVLDTVTLHPGDAFDPGAAARSQAALLRLGVFRSVNVRLTEPERPESTKDLAVELAERPWRTLSPGFGFSIADGPRAFIELVQPNLFGEAIEGTARARVNYPLGVFRRDGEELAAKPPRDRVEFRTSVGLHDPRVRVLGVAAGARAEALVEREHRPSYELTRAAVLTSLDLVVPRPFGISLQYELELDDVLTSDAAGQVTLTRADVERLRFPEGYTTLQSIRPVLSIDFRDNRLHPRRGWLATATFDYVRSIGDESDSWAFGLLKGSETFTHMLKLSGGLSGYLPLGGGAVLALSARAGRVLPLDRDSQTIGPKRFFLGGASTLRGWGEDELLPEDLRAAFVDQSRACAGSISGAACSDAARQIASGQTLVSEGGESFVLGKAELRLPVRGAAEVGFFADAGNLWLDPLQTTLHDIRMNVGAGVRFATPIGPAALDLGLNVTRDERIGERLWAPHFSIGLF
jgi:outer membrane protein assembly factor BamA